jgi:hypothetical protein
VIGYATTHNVVNGLPLVKEKALFVNIVGSCINADNKR